MRFISLGSGSQGNAHLIETNGCRILVDCGFPAREIERRLGMLNIAADTLDAVLITHEHTDHIRGLGPLARRHRLPTWMTAGTHAGAAYGNLPELHIIDCHAGNFTLGDLGIHPYPVPHDSREPCQFTFRSEGLKLGLLTDLGHITPHVQQSLNGCDSLILEFNHDLAMLASGPYPPRLQARVGGSHGHLNNRQSVGLLSCLGVDRLQHLVAAHLSEKNNTPELVMENLFEVHQRLEAYFSFAEQHRPGGWCEVTST